MSTPAAAPRPRPRSAAPTRTGRPASAPATPRTRLTVVPPAPHRPPRAPFLLLVGVLLVGGLVGLLLLNTALAQGSFEQHRLQKLSSDLADREQALVQQIAAAESPARLAERAKALGMVPAPDSGLAFLQPDGTVKGTPTVASPPPSPSPPASSTATPRAGTAGTKPTGTKTGSPRATPGAH